MKYRVINYNCYIGKKLYSIGDIIEHFDGYPWSQAIQNKALEIVEDSKEAPKKEHKKEENSKDKTVNITKAGPWYKVLDNDGNLIGKATRDEEEAKLIAEEYSNS